MAEVGGGNLLERLGPDLSAAVVLFMENPADLVRLSSVSHSWRRFGITYSTIMYKPRTLRFRLGHLRDENTNHEESPEQNYNWTYVSTKFLLAQTDNVQSIKLPRPIICIGGLLQIELMSSGCPTDELFDNSIPEIEAIGRSLAPTLDVSGIRTGNLVLMYFPGLVGDRQQSSYSRSKFIGGLKRRRNRR